MYIYIYIYIYTYVFIYIKHVSFFITGVWFCYIIVNSSQKTEHSELNPLNKDPPITEIAYVCSCFIGILWYYLFLLLSYQTYLIASNVTGYECINSPSDNRISHDSTDYDSCDSPYTKNTCENLHSFICIRDDLLTSLKGKGVLWKPINWKKPPPKTDIDLIGVFDNVCRNRYYSCC
jgi:hypothetical protein